jgi:hypothetical protein
MAVTNKAINLHRKPSVFDETWSPKVIGELECLPAQGGQ